MVFRYISDAWIPFFADYKCMKNTNLKFDIVIIGAGLAGSFSAYLLAKKGLKVALLERSQKFKRKVCGEYLCPAGVGVLENSGLGDIIKNYLPILGMKLASPTGLEIDTHFPQILGRSSRGISLVRGEVDLALLEKAKEQGVEVFLGVQTQRFHKEKKGWRLQTSIGDIRGKLLIGADGVNSLVARELGLAVQSSNHKMALHCHLNPINHLKRLGQMHILSNGSYVGIDPINEREVNFSIVFDKKKLDRSNGLHSFINGLIKNHPLLKKQIGFISDDVKINAVAKIHHQVTSPISDRAALIGDAAGFLDPLTGEGMYNALKTAELLVNSLDMEKIQRSLDIYKKEKIKSFQTKKRINQGFQFLIKRRLLCHLVGICLKTFPSLGNRLIGLIGNVLSPLEVLLPMKKIGEPSPRLRLP